MYRKAKIGLITISDNREKAHNMLLGTNRKFEDYVVNYINTKNDFELVVADTVVHTAKEAVSEAKKMSAKDVDGVIFN
ncbi:MAG: hypothetical protein RR292_07925, partial [Christensenellaceae bacterium]